MGFAWDRQSCIGGRATLTFNTLPACVSRSLFAQIQRPFVKPFLLSSTFKTYPLLQVVVPGPAKTTMTRDFTFHACLGPEVMQPDVLTLCGVPQLLDAALAGYNVTIFAYGQTGEGKHDEQSLQH